MIHGCEFRGSNLSFHNMREQNDKNIFTIIVGKNGVGKSLLLRDLILNFVPISDIQRNYPLFEKDREETIFNFSEYPSKIIASSTSPFDRFPVDRKSDYDSIYEYLGIKGLSSHNLSLGFIGRAIGALIKSLDENDKHLNTITNVFKYLDYTPYLKARMVFNISIRVIKEMLKSSDPMVALNNFLNSKSTGFSTSGPRRLTMVTSQQVNSIFNALAHFTTTNKKPRIDIIIDGNGIHEEQTGAPIDSMYSLLLEVGLLGVRDIELHKAGMQAPMRISDASSGEQCVLMALLGIAGHIKDNSLICIDEPEICLHPEWQEKYIELLTESFSSFKNCHFIVATHSPQIVSSLPNENCFALDLQKRETIRSNEVNKKSADFQLASIFGAPGYKNEYMSREIISALSALAAGQELPDTRITKLQNLIKLKALIDPTDPVYTLLNLLSEALEEE